MTSNLREINELLHRFFLIVSLLDLIISVFFFLAYSFKTIPEALKIIVLPAPFYNPHQQLFVEKLTDYPRVIGRKLR